MQKPRITEINVRMDCNGCARKIRKALNGINGIYDMYLDLPQQKLTIIGWANPDKILKAIKKTRKTATICSHVEATELSSLPTDQAALDATQQPPAETLKYTPPPPKQPSPKATPQPPPTENNASQQPQSNSGAKDVGEVHAVYHHSPNYGRRSGSGHSYNGSWERLSSNRVFIQEPPKPYNNSPIFMQEPPPPMYVTHSYNTYRSSPYVTEYEYVRSPPRHTYYYNHMEYYGGDYQNSFGNITSIFSDENPNACRIV